MSGTGGFQTQVTPQPAPAVAGDFASQNPYYTYPAGPGALVAGQSGVLVGLFAWIAPPDDPNGSPAIVSNSGAGKPAGFIHREQQGLIVDYLSPAGMKIQKGFAVTIVTAADLWAKNDGSTQALPGMKAYADLSTGQVNFAASGAPITGATATGSTIAAESFSVTGSIANDVLTVTAVGSGTIVAGATISGTGIASGTKVVSQVSGTAGGVGAYLVSIAEQTVASTTVSGTWGLFTVGTVTAGGPFEVGDVLNATGSVVAGTTITQLLTGDGGSASTFAVDNDTAVSSQTISAVSNVETNFYAQSTGLPGELVKMSALPGQ